MPFFDFTANEPSVFQGASSGDKPPKALMDAIGKPDTLIYGGYFGPDERSKEVNRLAEEAMQTTGCPDSRIVIADFALADDPKWIQFSLEYGVFFWEFEEVLFGEPLKSWLQTIGDCVSFGVARGCNDSLIIDAVNNGGATLYDVSKPVATEPIYAGSRVEVGGGRLGGDGSLNIWAIKWITNWGVLLRENHGSGELDLRTYSGSKARKWGARGAGCPNELEPKAKLHPITGSTPIKDADAAIPFIVNLNPITIASNRGFSRKRNSDGTCDPVGSWAHEMVIRGVCILSNGKLVFIIQNSWGDYLGSSNNVITTKSGRKVTLPSGCFAAEAEVVERDIFRPGDCTAIAGVRGWRATPQEKQAVRSFTANSVA